MFNESRFTLMLAKSDGQFIGFAEGFEQFRFSFIKKTGVLRAGEYVLLVDCAWDPSHKNHQDFTKVVIDVFTTSCSDL